MAIYRKYPLGYYVYYYLRNQDSETTNQGLCGTPYYVGKGCGARAWRFHTKNIRIPKDTTNIVIITEGLTEHQAFQIESLHIKLWGRKDLGTGILHNKTNGGDGASGTVRSPDTREKIRQTLKARPGRKHSESTKALISLRNRERVLTPEAKAKMLVNLEKGRGKQSEQTRQKISQKHKGRNRSEEHKESLRRAWITRDKTPYNKGTISPRLCCIQCHKDYGISQFKVHLKLGCDAISQ
jgi:hypothetical protein